MLVQKWNETNYQTISSVSTHDDELSVTFADGTTVTIRTEQVLPLEVNNPSWDSLRFDASEIVVPTAEGETEIPWTTIRLLTDKEFAVHWANTAEEQAKEVGLQLRELRKRRGLSSKDVAERAGISAQSLSRIELGQHDVVFTTLRKILAAMGCSLQDLSQVHKTSTSLESLLSHLELTGIKREWVLKKIIPDRLLEQLELSKQTDSINSYLNEAANYISRIFKWSPESILGADPLSLDSAIVQAARFKTQGRTHEVQATAYAMYAHFLALLVVEATNDLPIFPLPKSAHEVRENFIGKGKLLTFEGLVRYVWSLGVPVIPLQDSGGFHGACWKIDGRHVIVLKQVTSFQARWLYDLAHELGHVILHLLNERDMVIEAEEIAPFQNSDEEKEANKFSNELLFAGRAEELTQKSVSKARHDMKKLKGAVYEIASTEQVSPDTLANYIAYRLSKSDKINWWGTAKNLQITEPSPFEIAQQVFYEHVNMERLNAMDRELVERALGVK